MKKFKKKLAQKTISMITSAFGLVAALAWNEVIKETVTIYIKPFFGKSSGIISLLIYAVVVTFLAVLVTYNVTRVAEKD